MIKRSIERTGLSRRSFLQWAGALGATAAAYGCSTDGGSDYSVVTPQDSLVLDKTVKEVSTAHISHCISMCMLKLHVKNGKLLKITSGGDISVEQEKANAARLIKPNGTTNDEKAGIVPGVWCQSDAADESIGPIQRRACMKGLSETKLVYAPDRLKYPLKQKKNRGDLSGFERITWPEAFRDIKAMYDDIIAETKQKGLTYLPVVDNASIGRFEGYFTVSTFGASSTGGVNDGYWASLGAYIADAWPPVTDMFNSKFIIAWSSDLRNNRGAVPFYLNKAKDLGIPILDINAYHTDTSATSGWNPTPNDGVPPYIHTNGGTDPCLQAALAYIIFKNNLHDDAYLEEFSFAWAPKGYPAKKADAAILSDTTKSDADVTTAISTADTTETWKRTRADDALASSSRDVTPDGDSWSLDTYECALPETDASGVVKADAKIGDTFVEYLISLEHEWGGAADPLFWDADKHYWVKAGDTTRARQIPAAVGDAVYNKVLAYAERITGVKAEVIVAIAKKYANAKHAYILSPFTGGASRSQNGMYHTWMMICLQAMCGHLNKSGGGSGSTNFADGYTVSLGQSPIKNTVVPKTKADTFPILNWCMGDTIMSGHDSRTLSEMRDDTKAMTGDQVDLGSTGATIRMYHRASGHNSPLQQQPDLTKNMHIFKNKNYLKYIVVHELFMSPLAAIADIVLPAGHYFERSNFTTAQFSDRLMAGAQGHIKPLYETKHDQQIMDEFWNYCGYTTNRNPENISEDDVMKAQWEGGSIPAAYKTILDSAPASPQELPSYDKMKEEANVQLPVPLKNVKSKLMSVGAGKLWSQTGYVQFMSPWMKEFEKKRDTGLCIPGGWRAGYHQLDEGYERLLDYTNGTPDGTPGTGMPGLKRKNINVGVTERVNGVDEKVFTDTDIDNRFRYPLQLGTPHLIQRSHAHWDNIAVLKDLNPHVVHMHPSTAGKRGINDGDMVYVYNDNGCIKIPAKVTRRVKPQSIIIGQGAWYRASTTETYKAFFRNAEKGVQDATFRQGSDYAAPLIDDGSGNMIPDPARKGNSGKVVMWEVPVDVGGAVNSLCLGRNCGTGTPLIEGSVALPTVGVLCEVSKTHPDKN